VNAVECGELATFDEPVVMAYLPTWGDFASDAAALDLDTLTHVAVAFAIPGSGGTVFSDGVEAEVAVLVDAAHARGVKVLASLGGFSHSPDVRARLDGDIEAYADELAAFIAEHRLDGLDVDIEGGSVDSTYTPLVQALAARLRPDGKLLTAAVGQWFADVVRDEALFCLDFVGVMSYDLLDWDSGGPVPSEHASYADAQSNVRYWVERDYPPERVVLGMPFYGYCFGEGCTDGGRNFDGAQLSYSTIAELFPAAADQDWYEEGDVTLSLNAPATIEKKTRLGAEHGGVMIWESRQDSPDQALMNAVRAGLSP
jgi:GH18 family chitinase